MADQVLNNRRSRRRFRNLTIEPLETRHLLSGFPATSAAIPSPLAAGGGEAGSVVLPEGEGESIQVRTGVAIVGTPSESDHADRPPDSIGSIDLGTSFFLEIWVQGSSAGIVGGHVDIDYTTQFVDATGVMDHAAFDLFASGTADELSGHVDDFGGATWSTTQGVAPEWARFGYLEFLAVEAGVVSFQLQTGELEFSLSEIGNVPWTDVSLSDTQVRVGLSAVDDSFAVFDTGTYVAIDVLANDVVLGEESVTISNVIPDGSEADIHISLDGKKLMYKPASGYVGTDRFRYEIRDAAGFTDIAQVEVSVSQPSMWRNNDAPNDVNADGLVTPLDVLEIVNAINSRILPTVLPTPTVQVQPPPYVDVNGDGQLTTLDVLVVINQLNEDYASEGESGQLPLSFSGQQTVVQSHDLASRNSPQRVQFLSPDFLVQRAAITSEQGATDLWKRRTKEIAVDHVWSTEVEFGPMLGGDFKLDPT